ncbi:9259_t:CDS:2 [Entrophospora sp. SA101]|nr:12444_t:CDS:2 [Entrophospora sp. SA101]CAJ0751173.1 755_t:CDS:2 [Entrophospora sp. SA101]CAJ0752163.1 9259_t:CDS:2 [Entrophospora sp. SA101]CAJ0824292.1 3338_t:CDS:2 [Entrophospora sp. SA101]CAJ0824297.1 3342_t:CDS:2 [Entrophospora sp. SA101]
MGIAPLAWASYSDTYATRRKVYLASILLYIIASILCGISRNIWLLLVMRALQACGGSSVQSLGVATISDTFHSFERGTAYGLFYVGPLVGPIMGPIFGGYLTDYLETFRHQKSPPPSTPCIIKEIIEEKENIGNGNGNGNDEKLKESLNISSPTSQRFNPIAPLKLLRYPNVALTVIFVSVAFSLIYVVGTLLPNIFQQRYNLSTSQVGLVFLPPGIGYMLGSIFGGRYSDYVLAKSTKNLSEKSNNNMESGISNEYPELRLKSALLGGILMPIAYVMYGWFINYNINLIAPLSMLFIGGASLMIIFSSTSTYLVDSFPKKSASVIAANNFGRSITTALMSILAKPFEDLIGTGWLYTSMALLSVITGFGLVL